MNSYVKTAFYLAAIGAVVVVGARLVEKWGSRASLPV